MASAPLSATTEKLPRPPIPHHEWRHLANWLLAWVVLAVQVGVLALAVGVLPGGCRALTLPWLVAYHLQGPQTEQVGTKELALLGLLGVTLLAWTVEGLDAMLA